MSLRDDYLAGKWTPPCAWCGKASDRRLVIAPGMVHTSDTGTFRITMAREVPACEDCGRSQLRVSPAVRRARVKFWSTLNQRRQDRLF